MSNWIKRYSVEDPGKSFERNNGYKTELELLIKRAPNDRLADRFRDIYRSLFREDPGV